MRRLKPGDEGTVLAEKGKWTERASTAGALKCCRDVRCAENEKYP